MILTNDEAKKVLNTLLDTGNFKQHQVSGYYYDQDKWIVFDNTTHDCFVEETDSEEKAIKSCNREIEYDGL